MYNFRCVDNDNKGMIYNGNMSMTGMECPVVYECPIERVCHREIHHHVPHVCPINTRVINHHIYKHTYQPCFSYSEEDETSESDLKEIEDENSTCNQAI